MNTWIKIECTHGVMRCLSPPAYKAYQIVCRIWGEDVFITSLDGDIHLIFSLHYNGNAFDLRPPKKDRDRKIRRLIEELGTSYDVIVKPNYIHIEYDPK